MSFATQKDCALPRHGRARLIERRRAAELLKDRGGLDALVCLCLKTAKPFVHPETLRPDVKTREVEWVYCCRCLCEHRLGEVKD